MKNIFRIILPCLALVAGLSSCQESLIDDKASIDASHEATRQTPPTVTLAESASSVDAKSATVSFTISDTTNVDECGLMVSDDSAFKTYSVTKAVKNPSVTAVASGLSELTTYYIRAYAVTNDGATVLSDKVVSVQTPELPTFELEGDYEAGDYEYDSDAGDFTAPTESYNVHVAFKEGSSTVVEITNLFNVNTTIEGTWDAEKNTVSIPSGSYLFTHSKYGDAQIIGVDNSLSSTTENIILTFTAKGGVLETSNYQVKVSAGSFGVYHTSMSHK